MTSSHIFEGLASISQLSVAIILAIGVYVAWRQMHSWKDEARALRKAKLAEEIIALSAELRDSINAVRSPLGYGPPPDQEPDPSFDYRRRLNELADLDDEFFRFRRLMTQQRAIIGSKETKESMEAFFGARKQLIIALRGRIRSVSQEGSNFGRPLTDAQLSRIERQENLIWENGVGDDPIKSLLDPAIEQIDSTLLPIVRLD